MTWPRGDGTLAIVEVVVRRDDAGRVTSAHGVQSPADEATLLAWPSGGMEQVAHALLTEAVRREAVLAALLVLSDAGNAAALRTLDADGRRAQAARLAPALIKGMSDTIARIAEGAMLEALEGVLSDAGPVL